MYLVKNCRSSDVMRRFTELRNPGFQTKQMPIYQHKAMYMLGNSIRPPFPLICPTGPCLFLLGSFSSNQSLRQSAVKHIFPQSIIPGTTGRELDYVVDTGNMHQCKVFEVEDKLPELDNMSES